MFISISQRLTKQKIKLNKKEKSVTYSELRRVRFTIDAKKKIGITSMPLLM